MRIKLTLKLIESSRNVLPFNYQYQLSSWIYKTLNNGNSEFADFLHKKGYVNNSKCFKLFCFSNLYIHAFKIKEDRLVLNTDTISLIVSFYPIEALEPFITGIFNNQIFMLGDRKSQVPFVVHTVERIPETSFQSEHAFKLLSPVHITSRSPYDQSKISHLNPEHKEYERLFFQNLADKYNAYNESKEFNLAECKLNILTEPRPKLITIKANTPQQTKLKAFNFRFRVKAPTELIHIGYYAGFGKANAQGFGCAEVVGHDN